MESRNRSDEVWYQCTVFLNDIIIHDNTKFATAADAKAYVAEKALQQVRHKCPMPGPTKGSQHVPPPTASYKEVSDPIRRQEELRQQLMHRNKSNIAETTQYNLMASSNIDMGDHAQARAFVEGYKMGQLAAQRAADDPRPARIAEEVAPTVVALRFGNLPGPRAQLPRATIIATVAIALDCLQLIGIGRATSMRRIDVVDFAGSTTAANASGMGICARALDDLAPNAVRANFFV
ncbi:hypothetical protein SLS53_003628 [Cytospora paraplurivora]|uniref:Uncharacterized protein n=1 Tax=Cytospora paraplurivora TaxID=2898453 RepID=A0AAN9YII4_9PEZI